jgi:hypothetical protein
LSIRDPGAQIPDPKTATKERGEQKKIAAIPFFVATTQISQNCFIFELVEKKVWANFQRIIELFTQIIVIKLSKI